MFEDFDPLEATTPIKRGFKNPRPSIFEDFDPPEATTPLTDRCESKYRFNKSTFNMNVVPFGFSLLTRGTFYCSDVAVYLFLNAQRSRNLALSASQPKLAQQFLL